MEVDRTRQQTETATAAPDHSDEVESGDTKSTSEIVLAKLYAENAGELTGYLRKAFGDGPPDPEDISQEAFRKLAEQKDLSVIDNLRAFLWRTARNLTLDYKRQIAVRSKFDFEVEHLLFAVGGPAFSPENVLGVKEQLQIIEAVLLKMPARRRKAFYWHRVEGQNFSEVGRRLGISRRAVLRHVTIAAQEIDEVLRAKVGPSD